MRTVADLLSNPALGGGIRHTLEILEALLLDTSVESVVDAVDRLGNGAGLKRLGYLLEVLERDFEAIDQPLTSGISLLDPALPPQGPEIEPLGSTRERGRIGVIPKREVADTANEWQLAHNVRSVRIEPETFDPRYRVEF